MAGFITKLIVTRLFKETPSNAHGTVDPAIESTPATRLSHTIISSLRGPAPDPTITQSRSTRKLRRALPPGLTESEQRCLIKTKRRAYILDASLFSLCGLRFGWGSVIGFIPVIGDFADMILALFVLKTAVGTLDPPAPASLKLQMVFNIIIDFLVGLVPFVGDVVDAAYKANTKNAVLLERYLREKGQRQLAAQGQAGQHTDYSLPEEWGAHVESVGGVANLGPGDLEAGRGHGYGTTGAVSGSASRGGSRQGQPQYAPGPAVPPPVVQQGGLTRESSKLKKSKGGRR